jgi:hypothetical protein
MCVYVHSHVRVYDMQLRYVSDVLFCVYTYVCKCVYVQSPVRVYDM